MLRLLFLKRAILFMVSIVVFCTPCLAEMNEITVVTETWPPFRIADETSEYKYAGIFRSKREGAPDPKVRGLLQFYDRLF